MRQRVINQDDNDDVNEQESFIMNMNKRNSNNQMPTAADLLTSETKPSKTGYCEKKNNSILLYYFPFLSCLYPLWKRRYFILIGNYLFKYESQDGEKPKGVPIPLDASTVKILDDDRTSFEISLIRKTYIIKCSNVDECRSWVVALRDRKAQAIREKLGHAPITDSGLLLY